MRRQFLPLFTILIATLLVGCNQRVRPSQTQPVAPAPASEQALLYNLMVGEIAGHRGALEESVSHYLHAVEASQDPAVMRRATKIAMYAKDYDASAKIIRRWLEVAPDSMEAHQLMAMLSLRRGDIPNAVDSLEQLITHAEKHNGKARGFRVIGALLEREEDKARALEVMEGLLARHADDFEAHMATARLAYQVGNYQRAQQAAQQAIALNPEDVGAQVLLAQARIEMGEVDQALEGLALAVKRSPKDQELRLSYARLLVTANRLESAIKQFRTLLKAAPDNTDLLYSAALLSLEVKSFDDAKDYLLRMLKQGARQQEAWYYLGRAEEERKRYKAALDWYAKVDSGTLYIDAQFAVARTQGKLGQIDKARERFRLIRENDSGLAVRTWLGESDLMRALNRDRECYEVLDNALKELPGNLELLYSRALAAERIDRIDVLERDLKIVLEADPENAHALNALGYTLADRTERYEEAMGYIQKAFELEPNDPAIIDSMGWIQYRLGNLDEALKFLRRASLELKDSEIAAHLGEVLWVAGERDEALETWNRALKDDPDSKILKRVLKRFNVQ